MAEDRLDVIAHSTALTHAKPAWLRQRRGGSGTSRSAGAEELPRPLLLAFDL